MVGYDELSCRLSTFSLFLQSLSLSHSLFVLFLFLLFLTTTTKKKPAEHSQNRLIFLTGFWCTCEQESTQLIEDTNDKCAPTKIKITKRKLVSNDGFLFGDLKQKNELKNTAVCVCFIFHVINYSSFFSLFKW